MSNSIWHKRDETPKDFCDMVLADNRTGSCCVFFSPFHNVSFNYDKWCYLTDLIAQADKAERLQKAVDLAVHSFNEIRAGVPNDIWVFDEATKATNKIEQLIKGNNQMTSKLKCPFCQRELKIAGEHTTIMSCFNGDCYGSGLYGEKAFWQELIRTRKALNAAINAMKSASAHNTVNCVIRGEDPAKDDVGITINRALEQITAPEQKEQN